MLIAGKMVLVMMLTMAVVTFRFESSSAGLHDNLRQDIAHFDWNGNNVNIVGSKELFFFLLQLLLPTSSSCTHLFYVY